MLASRASARLRSLAGRELKRRESLLRHGEAAQQHRQWLHPQAPSVRRAALTAAAPPAAGAATATVPAHQAHQQLPAPSELHPQQPALEQQPPRQQQQLQQEEQQRQRRPMHVLVRNEETVPCQLASGPWLEAAPRGAYTTARTVGGNRVFELTFHIERLASSARLMMKTGSSGTTAGTAAGAEVAAPAAADPARLRPRVLAAMRAGVRAYRAQAAAAAGAGSGGNGASAAAAAAAAAGELKLTVLVTWPGCDHPPSTANGSTAEDSAGSACAAPAQDPEAADVYVHVSPLPPRPAPPVRVVMRGAPRQNAAAKDSEWVRQRKALEAGLPPDVNEAVLVGEGGALYEGLTSNFFAVMDGAVWTAGEGVLAGTVREVALAVAAREGIPVVLEPPRLADLPRWQGCFITSTSRLLLPVDEASMFQEAQHAEQAGQAQQEQAAESRVFERGGLVSRLEQLVLAEVAACSEPLF